MSGNDNDDKPNIARAYDWLLKGDTARGYSKPADRQFARAVLAADPGLRQRCQDNRAFMCEAARRAADEGTVGQVIDIGAGLPASPAIHDCARSAIPDAGTAYVDLDELVEAAWLTEAGDDPLITVVRADGFDPAAVLGDKRIADVIDLRRPVCVLIGALLHYRSTDAAREIARAYMEPLAPGSWLAVSVVHYASADLLEHTRAASPAAIWNHSPAEFTSLFDGLELIGPGVGSADFWIRGMGFTPSQRDAMMLAGAARKP